MIVPQKIGRYEIESEVGRGGMATVYKAYDPHFDRLVAVKVLPREFMHQETFRARFTREAKTIAALEHAAIVPVYDYGEDDGQPFLVMRYMPGGSLSDRLKVGAIGVEQAVRITQRIAGALDRAHSLGIIHRDLKPGNILFDQFGDAFLADFGIARMTSASTSLTASGMLVGTPTYMSPEQVYGDKTVDGRSDIYALGVILFQMLTGQAPYAAETPAKLMMKHVLDPVPQVLRLAPNLPPVCEHVITKAMAKEPENRFATAYEMSVALTPATRQMEVPPSFAATQSPSSTLPPLDLPDVSDEPVTPIKLTPPPEIVSPPTPEPAVSSSPVSRRLPGWVWVIGILGVVLCLAVGVGLFALVGNPLFLASPTVTTQSVDVVIAASATPESRMTETAVAATATVEAARVAGTATQRAQDVAVAATETAVAAAMTLEATSTASISGELTPLVGPISGTLVHELDDRTEAFIPGITIADFIIEVEVGNPFDTATGLWDTGLIFRQTTGNREMRLVIRSNGSWNLNNRDGSVDDFITEGNVGDVLRTGANESNKIVLVAQGERGYFFLNNSFVSFLDLSERMVTGDLAIATGFYVGDEQAGAETIYNGFTVWSLEPAFGPEDGTLPHMVGGVVRSYPANVDLLNFVADVTVTNPYDVERGNWDIGYAFREAGTGELFWLVLQANRDWVLLNRIAREDSILERGEVETLNVAEAGQNRFTLIARDGRGYMLVNDSLVATLNLSDRLTSGNVKIVTAFFRGNDIPGEETRYQSFTVWPLP